MRLLVTGAGGFLGRHVVEAAARRGHRVLALVRRPPGFEVSDAVELVYGDLCQRGDWEVALSSVDAVIHLAMGVGGFSEQFAGTVVGTENLIAAVDRVGETNRMPIVLASTFSVYDYLSMPAGSVLDEGAPIETHPRRRDAYLQTKLLQEELIREHQAAGAKVVILRPGAIYGPGHLWRGGAALQVAGRPIAIGPTGQLKLTYVEHCAEAFVLAGETSHAYGEVLNIVDDELPNQREFAAALRRHGFDSPPAVPLPYAPAHALARLTDLVNQAALGGRAKVPALLSPARLAAEYKPLRYSNAKAKRVLQWNPQYSLDEALARCRR